MKRICTPKLFIRLTLPSLTTSTLFGRRSHAKPILEIIVESRVFAHLCSRFTNTIEQIE